jgi:DNA-binding MarR family transcriptional regulator
MFDRCLYFNTTALARQLEKEWTKAFSPLGLTPPQAFMLRTILDRPGMLQCELAKSMAISRPTTTRTLDGLSKKGLVERRSSERDGREQTVHATPAARLLQKTLNEASGNVTRRLKRLLGEEVFNESVIQVRRIRSALE